MKNQDTSWCSKDNIADENWCSKDNIADENNNIADENNNSSISDHSTLTDNNANNIETTDPTEVANVRNAKLGLFNGEKCVLQKSLDSNSQLNLDIRPICNKLIKGSVSVENEVLAVYNNSNLVKQRTRPFNPQGKLILDPQYNKSRVALHSALRAKEGQVNLSKAQVNQNRQSRNQEYTLSEVEIHYQLWKMFVEKIDDSEYQFPLSEQSDHTTSVPVSVFPSLPRYCSDVMWCTARGGNSNATATLQKVRTLFKQAVPKARSLPLSYAKPLQQAPVSSTGGNLPHSDLAISAKTKAELKAQSNLNDHSLLSLFPSTKTSLKAFYQPMPPLQGASSSELFAAVQDFSCNGATCSVLDSNELPSGRQVPTDPQGRKQTGQGSYQEGQSKGAVSGSVQSGGISSEVGGQSGASGGDGGDGDPPWKDTRSHYDVEPKPKKKKKKKKAVEDGKEALNSADSVTSDDEPRPKPRPQSDRPYNECEADEQPRQNDSGTHLESPASTHYSGFAEEEHKAQPHSPEPCLPDNKLYYQGSQNVEALLVSHEHEETSNLPMPFPHNASPPRLSPQTLSPPASPSSSENMFPSPPSSHDSAVSSQSEAGSSSYSSLSDTSAGIEETEQPAGCSEQAVFPQAPSVPAPELNTTFDLPSPLTATGQPMASPQKMFNPTISPRATPEVETDDDSNHSNNEEDDRASG